MKRIPFLLTVCALSFASQLSAFTIDGSRTMYELNVALTAKYRATNPGVNFVVQQDGTTKGIEKVILGEIDAAAVTRRLRPNEISTMRKVVHGDGVFVPVAREGISIYLHPQNHVDTLTVEQIAGIYSGRITSWKEVGGADLPIHVYAFDITTGRYWYLAEEVMKKEKFAPNVTYTSAKAGTTESEALAAKAEQMVKWVSSDPSAIGFGSLKKIRIVKMARIRNGAEAFWPTPADVASGKYPLQRTLGYVLRTAPTGALRDFIEWAVRDEETIRTFGFVPMH